VDGWRPLPLAGTVEVPYHPAISAVIEFRMGAANLLTRDEQQRAEAAVAAAECATTAEIKIVHLRWCWVPLHAKAVEVFHRLGLDRAREHNCVLILLVETNREFVIYGDRGITARVGPDYWFDVRDVMGEHFRKGQMATGLCAAIEMVGAKLAQHYPAERANENEIDDSIVREQ